MHKPYSRNRLFNVFLQSFCRGMLGSACGIVGPYAKDSLEVLMKDPKP